MPVVVKNAKQYKGYLRSKHWYAVSRMIKETAGWACQLCNLTDTKLEVHHRDYNRIGEKKEHLDCICLCCRCHRLVHSEILD